MPSVWTIHRLVAFAVGALWITAVVAGCGGSPASAGVPWADYAPSIRAGIDAAAGRRDCDELQLAFDTADANDDATRARTGHGNAELMRYIDGKMRAAGCY